MGEIKIRLGVDRRQVCAHCGYGVLTVCRRSMKTGKVVHSASWSGVWTRAGSEEIIARVEKQLKRNKVRWTRTEEDKYAVYRYETRKAGA